LRLCAAANNALGLEKFNGQKGYLRRAAHISGLYAHVRKVAAVRLARLRLPAKSVEAQALKFGGGGNGKNRGHPQEKFRNYEAKATFGAKVRFFTAQTKSPHEREVFRAAGYFPNSTSKKDLAFFLYF
jgi:hypothetical protein